MIFIETENERATRLAKSLSDAVALRKQRIKKPVPVPMEWLKSINEVIDFLTVDLIVEIERSH